MSKAIVNALAMALAMDLDIELPAALEFAARWVEENDDLFTPMAYKATAPAPGREAEAVQTARESDRGVASPTNPAGVQRVAVLNANGLTAAQQAALDGGIGLCPNCQQPTNNHLPGCARASGEDPKARTKAPLPPVQ